MKTILSIFSIALGLSIGISTSAFAVCQETGNTPSGGNVLNCTAPVQNNPLNTGTVPGTTIFSDQLTVEEGGGLNVAGSSAVDMDEGDDFATVNGGSIITDTGSALRLGPGNNTATVNNGTLIGSSQAIQGNAGGNNIITVNAGILEGGSQTIQTSTGIDDITINGSSLRVLNNDVIETGQGDDRITVNGGTLDASNPGANQFLDAGADNDEVFLNGGTYIRGDADDAVQLAGGNDLLRFGADIDLDGGLVNCGDGFDTLVFAMDVPLGMLNGITNQILASNPSGDSIVINDITYEWINCEQLVPDLNGVRFIRPIPTLSQWGLIAMAGLIGVVGIWAVRRKKLVDPV